MLSPTRILAITRKELRQLRRDPLTLGMIFGVPLLQMTLFGYAINTDVRHLRAGVLDAAGTQRARWLVTDAVASQVVRIVARADTPAALEAMLRRGEIAVGLVIPRDVDRRLQGATRPAAQLLVDGGDPVILGVAQGLARLPALTRGIPPGGRAPPATFEVRAYYNPERRSAVQIVPGLVGTILTMTMVLFTAVALVRERERGTLELLITTPVRRSELMVGKVIPYLGIGALQVTLVLAVGTLLFHVPIRGRLLDLYAAAGLFVGASLTLGLIISTVARTQFQAMQLTVFVFLPSILLSGFMFPFDGMPRPAQYIGSVLPLTHFLRMIRGIVLRGATLVDVLDDAWPLVVFSAAALLVAILRFRKRLD